MEILQKITAFFDRYRTVIMAVLALCCIMQQCTIGTLRNELKYYKNKYEAPANNTPLSEQMNSDQGPNQTAPVLSDGSKGGSKGMSAATLMFILGGFVVLAGAGIFLLRYKSIYPFTLSASGKIWQDPYGRVVYTLTVRNKGRKPVNVANAMIEFAKIKDRRKFRMPVADFPMTLTEGTKHSVNIPLQKLLEQHQELLDYKMIRVSVDGNGTVRKTFPLAIRWKRQ